MVFPSSKYNWKEEIHNIVEMDKAGLNMSQVAEKYGVSRQRMKQIYTKFKIILTCHERRRRACKEAYLRRWGNLDQDFYDLKRTKYRVKKANAVRMGVEFDIEFSEIVFPVFCPILGLELDYEAGVRQDNSISFDRIDPSKGYIKGNVAIISFRANRIKNDGTREEHQKIVDYIDKSLKMLNN